MRESLKSKVGKKCSFISVLKVRYLNSTEICVIVVLVFSSLAKQFSNLSANSCFFRFFDFKIL